MQLDQLHTSQGYAAQALELCERSRARNIFEILSGSGIDVREGVDPALLEKERSINQQLDYYTDRKLRLAGSNGKQQEFDTGAKSNRRTRMGNRPVKLRCVERVLTTRF